MQLIFDSVDEVRDFVKSHLKGSRGAGKDKDEGEAGSAPAPLAPPAGSAQQGFAGPGAAQGFGGAGTAGGFGGGPTVPPDVQALVTRIGTKLDESLKAGHNPDQALIWFRQQCGAEAANATLDQIRQSILPKMTVPFLTQMAGFMNA